MNEDKTESAGRINRRQFIIGSGALGCGYRHGEKSFAVLREHGRLLSAASLARERVRRVLSTSHCSPGPTTVAVHSWSKESGFSGAALGTRGRENSHLKNRAISRTDLQIGAKGLNFDNFQLSMNAPPHRISRFGKGCNSNLQLTS